MLDEVGKYIRSHSSELQDRIEKSIQLLKDRGHQLSMPDAKPIGGGLWELRVRTNPPIRILYGFCREMAILLVIFQKQRPAIPRASLERAKRLLEQICRYH
jgi:phage-related protein